MNNTNMFKSSYSNDFIKSKTKSTGRLYAFKYNDDILKLKRVAILTPVNTIEKIIEKIKKLGIVVSEKEQICNYLYRNPHLIEPLQEIVARINNTMKADQFVLEKYKDPEYDDESLVLFIRMNTYNNSFLNEIDKLREELLPIFQKVSGKISITTDFQIPDYV